MKHEIEDWNMELRVKGPDMTEVAKAWKERLKARAKADKKDQDAIAKVKQDNKDKVAKRLKLLKEQEALEEDEI